MANICPDCQKEFYSDTEFAEHQNMEMMRKFMEGGIAANKQLSATIDRLISVILEREIIRISETRGISQEEAAQYWFDSEVLINRKLNEQYQKWKDQQTLK